jgi:tetratricopeptide (TPR) repeat protein
MKTKNVILAVSILATTLVFAQKDELKTLKKIYDKETPSVKDVTEFKSTVAAAEPLVANGTEQDKLYVKFYKASIPAIELSEAMSKPENRNNPAIALNFFNPEKIQELGAVYSEVLDYEKKSGKEVLTKKIQDATLVMKPMLINYAIQLGNDNKYLESSKILNTIYQLDKKDVEKLYFAAGYAVNGKDYDAALNYYNELIALNYSGEGIIYKAKSLANGSEESFNTKVERDNFVKLKTHEKPTDEKIPSKRGEIYKNVALILQSQSKIEEAKKVIKEAVKLNPEDSSLMLAEANLYLETKDLATYKNLITEILNKFPNNSELYYNLGVLAYNNKETAEAEKFYTKAIEIDPKNVNANLNMAILKLDAEKDIIAKMNKLGSTPADNKKYEVLKNERNSLFTNALPYLEKAVELDENNKEAAKTLLSVYNALEIMDKAKALKAKINASK